MNPYFYLFYKLNRFLNKKGSNEMGPIVAISFVISANIAIIYVNLFDITAENLEGTYKVLYIIVMIALFIFNSILFLSKKRIKEIVNLYGRESNRNRIVGNFLVILYIAVSFGLILFS